MAFEICVRGSLGDGDVWMHPTPRTGDEHIFPSPIHQQHLLQESEVEQSSSDSHDLSQTSSVCK